MDWLNFLASIIKSLAWPAVTIYLLYLVRGKIGRILENLADRVTKVKVPGGEAEFTVEIAKAREKSEELAIEEAAVEQLPLPKAHAEPIRADDPYVTLAKISPEAAIIEAFKELERVLLENWDLLANVHTVSISGGRNLLEFVRELNRAGLIPKEVVEQFQRVRELRNLAAHETGHPDISVGSAIEYRELCRSLVAALNFAFARLRGLNDPRPLG